MPYHLDFLNKNLFRKYPLRASSTHVFENGQILPEKLIASMQISVPGVYSKLYVSKVYCGNGLLSVTINEYATETPIGTFRGLVTSKYQVLPLESFLDSASGNLVVGDPAGMNELTGGSLFSKDNGLIEDSAIFCYTPPGVTLLTHDQEELTGRINLVLDNLTSEITGEEILLSVSNISLITSNNDFHGELNNCPTPLIRKINTVSPNEDGNIDIYGILPVTINVGTGEVEIIPGLTLDEACPERLKISPPDNDSDTYYTDILTATEPEWRTWPNFT